MINFIRDQKVKLESTKLNLKWNFLLTIILFFPIISISQENVQTIDPCDVKLLKSNINYSNPFQYDVDYIFELYPEFDKIDKSKDLKLWILEPRDMESQKNVHIVSIEPEPDSKYTDQVYGNTFFYWDFGRYPEKEYYRIKMRFRCESYEIHSSIELSEVKPYDETNKLYQTYTLSGRSINITPKVKELSQKAVSGEENPYLQAKQIYDFVVERVRYEILDYERARGTTFLLDSPVIDSETGQEYYKGSCIQMSALFVAMCRSVGIPARSVFGFLGNKNDAKEIELKKPLYDFEKKLSPDGYAATQSYGVMGPHMWAEFYLQNIGWIPVDPEAELFGQLFGKKIIMGIGRDIQLGPESPQTHHDGYGSQWMPIHNGKVDYPFYGVWNIAKIHTTKFKTLHHFDD